MASLIIPFHVAGNHYDTNLHFEDAAVYCCNPSSSVWFFADANGLIWQAVQVDSAGRYRVVRVLIGHRQPVIGLAYIAKYPVEEWPDEAAVASVDGEGGVAVWSASDGKCLLYHREPCLSHPSGVVFVEEANVIVVADASSAHGTSNQRPGAATAAEDYGKLAFFNAHTLELVFIIPVAGLLSVCGHQIAQDTTILVCRTVSSGLKIYKTEDNRASLMDCGWLSEEAVFLRSSPNYKYLLVATGGDDYSVFERGSGGKPLGQQQPFPPYMHILNDGTCTRSMEIHLEGDPGNSPIQSVRLPSQFTLTSLAQSHGNSVVFGGTGGYFLVANDFFADGDGSVIAARGPFEAPITAVLVSCSQTTWMGDAAGGLFAFTIKASSVTIECCLKASRMKIGKILEFGNYLLAVASHDRTSNVCIVHESRRTLLYTISSSASPLTAIYFGACNIMLLEYGDGHSLLQLDLPTGNLQAVGGIAEQFDQRVAICANHCVAASSKTLLEPYLHMFPHGLLKVLNVPFPGFPGILVTVDVRALVIECCGKSAECQRLANSIVTVLLSNGRGMGIVGANGNISLSLCDHLNFSSSEAAIILLSYMALGIGLTGTEDDAIPPPISISFNRYPSPSTLCKFWCDYVRPLERASRSILKHYITKYRFEESIAYWPRRLLCPPEEIAPRSLNAMNRSAIILAIIALVQSSNHAESLSFPLSLHKAIACSLFNELQDERKHLFRISAVHLFGKCFALWDAFVDGSIAIQLLVSWLHKSAANLSDLWTAKLLAVCRECIVDVLSCKPDLYYQLCNDIASGAVDISVTVSIIYEHLHQMHTTISLQIVITIMEAVIRLTDSSSFQKGRNRQIVNQLIFLVANTYNQIAFHPVQQLLAIGNPDGSLSVWDLSSTCRATKIAGLHHSHPTSYLVFENAPDGRSLLSYSFSAAELAVVRVEEPSAMAVFSSIIASSPVSASIVRREKVPDAVTEAIFGASKESGQSVNSVMRIAEWRPNAEGGGKVRMYVRGSSGEFSMVV